MNSTKPLNQIKKSYKTWNQNISKSVDEIESWEKEVRAMLKEVDQMRSTLSRHSRLLTNHRELLKSNQYKLNRKIYKLSETTAENVDKVMFNHQKEKDNFNFQQIAHECIRKTQMRFLSVMTNITDKLK